MQFNKLACNIFVVTMVFMLILSGTVFANHPRCLCPHTMKGINATDIQIVRIKLPSSECDKTEIIVQRRNGFEVCLDTTSPLGKKLMEKYLKRYEQ
uniref:UL146a n=1 Tax=Rhesus cytomegalovirus (strain 68-1) TaxID=47929 RepID=F8V7G5_RHCM6|nr:UL146a [macacine betaherpesvirus 3]